MKKLLHRHAKCMVRLGCDFRHNGVSFELMFFAVYGRILTCRAILEIVFYGILVGDSTVPPSLRSTLREVFRSDSHADRHRTTGHLKQPYENKKAT